MPTATENSIKSKTGMCMFEIYDGQAPVPVSTEQIRRPINTLGWARSSFLALSTLDRWTMVCECCNGPVMRCVNNIPDFPDDVVINHIDNSESTANSVTAVIKQKTGHRGKPRTTLTELNADDREKAIQRAKKGEGMVALAKEFNVQPPYMSELLKTAGVVIKKGKKAKT